MQTQQKQVAIVTGASRGAGRGIALALAKKGMIVYVTGRSTTMGSAIGWDGSILPGTVYDTAEQIKQAGGLAIPVVCDHSDDAQTAALFAQVEKEQGRLDILVNNAAFMHNQLIEQKPFWEKEVQAYKILDVGLRSAYIASWHAAQIMVKQGSGLIMFSSSFGASCYMHGPAYGAQKAGVDKLAHDMAIDFSGTGVRTVSIWMGPLLTERSAIAGDVSKEQYEQFMASAESPEFIGEIIYAIAHDPKGDELSGHRLISAEIAQRYQITDRDGLQPPSYRKLLGSPPQPNPAKIY
ncbi:SDR family NAD(P)-dependent oxidoreductase [Denitrificimonas sp. JX-1]|uniref:SDR family NAD(P)-dependent oxidoreductase n=1 Tax=Denitrificimonas halotolerans TaxID=3098930 RepID=A0ABU5GPG6_9GAMM|nr:SDR family NAD(P)-dependent oxidoreductase [Denitrificimonas sp. JX-1]MDY7218883.1 SDR family NAD(P)-dependent oxidoreductase [Denitrificimonas sp. JX-1]